MTLLKAKRKCVSHTYGYSICRDRIKITEIVLKNNSVNEIEGIAIVQSPKTMCYLKLLPLMPQQLIYSF